jgi:uncharacterized protein (TIGR02466 family)
MTNINNLETGIYFGSPIYLIEKPEWINQINKICDQYIKDAYSREKPFIKERENFLGKKDFAKIKDHGMSYHSTSILNDTRIKELQDFIGITSYNILDSQGFDMSLYKMFFTEFWVQEFSKNGGGHHDTHTHCNNHISGFYFLKCSEKTSFPLFHDPRPGAVMTKLTLKDKTKITLGQETINYRPKPGTMIFFNSYIPHQYVLDSGIEPFRFIHFNIQAVQNEIIEGVKKI